MPNRARESDLEDKRGVVFRATWGIGIVKCNGQFSQLLGGWRMVEVCSHLLGTKWRKLIRMGLCLDEIDVLISRTFELYVDLLMIHHTQTGRIQMEWYKVDCEALEK